MTFATPQQAEDAFYDAIDDNDLEGMLKAWEESQETICLLPMHALQQGREAIARSWGEMMAPKHQVEVSVRHIHWHEGDELAIHIVEETVAVGPERQLQPPIYATNIYRKGASGWRMLMHLNSPTPPPPGSMPNLAPPPGMGL
jgi:ketosteroid isomerase-like protein